MRRVIVAAGWLGIGQVFATGLSALVAFWMAQYVGVTALGKLGLAVSVTTLAQGVAAMGLGGVVARELTRRPKDESTILGSAFSLRVVAGIAANLVTFFFTFVLVPDYVECLIIVIVALGLIVRPFEIIESWFTMRVAAKPVVLARMASQIATALLRVAAILTAAPLLIFAAIVPIGFFLNSAGLMLAYWRSGGNPTRWRPRMQWVKKLLVYSWPFLIADFAATVYLKIDLVMIKAFRDDQDVGIYFSAVALVEMFFFLAVVVNRSVMRGIVDLADSDHERYHERLQQLYDLTTWLAIAIASSLTVGAVPLIELVYGKPFAASAVVLPVIAWSLVFIIPESVQKAWALAEGHGRHLVYGRIAAAIVNVLLNIVWVPSFGVIGAAWATVIAYALAMILPVAFTHTTRDGLRMQFAAYVAPLRWVLAWRRSH